MANQKSQIENRKFLLQAYGWLTLCALTGLAVLLLWRDSCQADGGIHFVLARWAWRHHELFVDVWSRPLFTLLYAFPALIGYQAARALTIAICVATAHQTWRLAEEHRLARAPLVIPFLFLQPSFTLFIADTMTEPLYALVFIAASFVFKAWNEDDIAQLMPLADRFPGLLGRFLPALLAWTRR